MKILTIEDHDTVRRLIVMALDSLPCEVIEASNGAEGLAMFDTHHPEVVLLDVMLPGEFNGIELCKAIRAQGRPLTKIIMISAKAQLADREEGIAAGADEYLIKPFSVRDLLTKLQTCMTPS